MLPDRGESFECKRFFFANTLLPPLTHTHTHTMMVDGAIILTEQLGSCPDALHLWRKQFWLTLKTRNKC